MDLRTGMIVGVEALLRWAHPRRGLVLPMSFIPTAEQFGLMAHIEDWVMEEAFKQTKTWATRYADYSSLGISVNLSVERFRDPDLVRHVSSLCRKFGIRASNVRLDITHYRLMDFSSATLDTLEALRESGVQIVIDNFGAGYSSLSYLRQFPADYISIDNSYVSTLGSNGRSAQVIRAMISLAQALDLRVIGEGVETVEQLEMLREVRCDFAQGNYFSEPVPSQRMSELLQ